MALATSRFKPKRLESAQDHRAIEHNGMDDIVLDQKHRHIFQLKVHVKICGI